MRGLKFIWIGGLPLNSYKDLFIGIDDVAYFYTGAECPSLKGHVEAFTRYAEDKSKGEEGRARASQMEVQLRWHLATMIRAKEHEIALAGNASEAINHLIDAMPIPEGSNIVLNDLEYPSVIFPWLSLQKRKNIELRIIPSHQGEISIEDFEKHIDANTYLVVVSHVSYLNGFRHDLKQLRALTRDHDALLFVDATQSLGVVDVDSQYFDMMVASSYKWLLGPHGLGVIYVSEELLPALSPKRVGWRSVPTIFYDKRFETFEFREDARKFEVGFNNYPAIYALHYSTNLLMEIGIENIERHVLSLGERLLEKLHEQGWNVLSPVEEKKRSGNYSIAVENGEAIMHALEKEQIKVWGGDGRVRMSIHFFNTIDEIEHLTERLKTIS